MQKLVFVDKSLNKLKDTAEKELLNFFSEGEAIAVKLHMGEKGNKYYLKPQLVKVIVNVLKNIGVRPFLFDSPVKYSGSRDTTDKYIKTAEEHGFTEQLIGCPIVISNESIKVKGKYMWYEVCKHLAEADGVLVLTHVKGHMCSGFGGAVKNLGMGAVTKKSKGDIHDAGSPELTGECTGCGACVAKCPFEALELKEGKVVLDKSCPGCSICIQECNFGALKPNIAMFDDVLADAACAALKSFKKAYYINAIIDIAKRCDCASDSDPILVDDIGILFGKDIIAIDKASIDLVNKRAGINLFLEKNNKDPLLQLNAGAELGMGEKEYRIE